MMKQARVSRAFAKVSAVSATTHACAFSTADLGSSLRRHLTGQSTPVANAARRACGSPSAAAAAMSAPATMDASAHHHHHNHHHYTNGNGNGSTLNGTNGVSHLSSSSAETVALLRQEVEMLRDELARRDSLISELRARLDAPSSSPSEASSSAPSVFPEGASVVATTTEFERAVSRHCDIIAVAAGSHVRPSAGVAVDPGQTVTIVGPAGCAAADRPVIEGHMLAKGSGAKLILRDIEVRAACRTEPAVSLGSSAHAEMHNVTLSNGRDGVYLSAKATATLQNCFVAGNTRGIFEMQRCHATMKQCAFADNLFHCVLLAAPQAVMAAKTARVHEDAHGCGNTFIGGRCDVALAYNPMEDRYSLTYRGPKEVALSVADSTAGLVDEAW